MISTSKIIIKRAR